ncbi:MAG: PspA/IM30 family protein [Armatimonadetes bacterium]|nr:PspA/IM30 family protein [Armatimonadota bacterium]
MWARIKAIFRSLFGWMIRGAENPELLLRQLMDDLRSEIPKMNAQVAEVVKHEKMLDMQVDRLEEKVAELEPKVEQAVKLGPEHKEAAKRLITELQDTKRELATATDQLARAHETSVAMMRKRDAYEQRIRQQIDEAKRQLSRARQAEVEEQLAETMGAFEVGDAAETLDRITDQIDEKLARAQARQQVASESLDTELDELELDVADQQAEMAYIEYQRQLGLIPDEEAERTMEAVSETPADDEGPAIQEQAEQEIDTEQQ